MEKDRWGCGVDKPQCPGCDPLTQPRPECAAPLRQELWTVEPQALKDHPTKVTHIDTFGARLVTAMKGQKISGRDRKHTSAHKGQF